MAKRSSRCGAEGVRAHRLAAALLLIGALAACASSLALPGPATAPPRLEGSIFHTRDGTKLPVTRWGFGEEEPAAILVALHGFNGYAGSFHRPASWWAERGIAIIAHDQRGFGFTASRGLWSGTAAYRDDAVAFFRLVKAAHPDTPVFLLGESMGGAVAILAATRLQETDEAPEGVILVSPAVWGRGAMNPFERAALWVTAGLFPGLVLTGASLERWPSDNIAMLRERARDPMILSGARMDVTRGLVNLMGAALEGLPDLELPTLALYGAREDILSDEAVAAFKTTAPAHVELRTYPEGWHMLLRDVQAERVLEDITGWVAAQTDNVGTERADPL